MKIFAKIKHTSKKEEIQQINSNNFEVKVKATPHDGKANEAVIKVLAEYLDISKSRIKIISGGKSKQKVLKIID